MREYRVWSSPHSYCVYRDLATAIEALVDKRVGRPLRWQGDTLHTALRRGERALSFTTVALGRETALSDNEKRQVWTALDAAAAPRRWRYAHVREMVALYRRAYGAVRQGGRVRLRWNSPALDLAGFRREFVAALHERINRKCDSADWRKLDPDYQLTMRRDCQAIRAHRQSRQRIHYLENPDLRARYGHLIEREHA